MITTMSSENENSPAFRAMMFFCGFGLIALASIRFGEALFVPGAKIDDAVEMFGVGLALVGISRLK